MQETQDQSLGREDSLEEKMATHSSNLAWRIPWTEEPGGLQSMGLQKSQTQLSNQSAFIYMYIHGQSLQLCVYAYICVCVCAFCLTVRLLMDTCCYQSLLLSCMWNSGTGKIVYGIKPQNSGSFCCGEDGNGVGRGMATWHADAVLPWSPRQRNLI